MLTIVKSKQTVDNACGSAHIVVKGEGTHSITHNVPTQSFSLNGL